MQKHKLQRSLRDLIISHDRPTENICIWQRTYRLYKVILKNSKKKMRSPTVKFAVNMNIQSIDRKHHCQISK